MNSCKIVLGILLYLSVTCSSLRTWKFETISFTSSTSDENLLNISMHVDRVSFSESAISGTVDFNFEADDTTMAEVQIFHSVSGRDEDYHETIYKIPMQTLSNFINNYYEGFLYSLFSDCSNIPRFEGKFVPPFPKQTYIFQKCMLSAGSFPDILPSGYYKVRMHVIGPVEFTFEYVSKITPKVI